MALTLAALRRENIQTIISRLERLRPAPQAAVPSQPVGASQPPALPGYKPVIRSYELEVKAQTEKSEFMTAIWVRYPNPLRESYDQFAVPNTIPGERFFGSLVVGLREFGSKHCGDPYRFINTVPLKTEHITFLAQLGELYQRKSEFSPACFNTAERLLTLGLEQPGKLRLFSEQENLKYLLNALTVFSSPTLLIDKTGDPGNMIQLGMVIEMVKEAVKSLDPNLLAKTFLEFRTAAATIDDVDLKNAVIRLCLAKAEEILPALLDAAVNLALEPAIPTGAKTETLALLYEVVKSIVHTNGQLLPQLVSDLLAARINDRAKAEILNGVLCELPEALPELLKVYSVRKKFSGWLADLFGIKNKEAAIRSLRYLVYSLAAVREGENQLLRFMLQLLSQPKVYSCSIEYQLEAVRIDGQLAKQVVRNILKRPAEGSVHSNGLDEVRNYVRQLCQERRRSAKTTLFLAAKLQQLSELTRQGAADEAFSLYQDLHPLTALAKPPLF